MTAVARNDKALMADVSLIGETLQQVAIDGKKAVSLTFHDELGKMAASPHVRALPKLAAMLDSLLVAIRVQGSVQGPGTLGIVMDQLLDCYYACRAVKTALQGKFNDQPALEALFGDQRADRKLETLRGPALVEVGWEAVALDGARRVETSYLLDLATGEILAEQQTRVATATAPTPAKRSWKGVVTADAARLHPGFTPRRIDLSGAREQPIEKADVDKVLQYARPTMEAVHKEYRNHRSNFFAPAEWPVLVSPKGYYAEDERIFVVDRAGTLMLLGQSAGTTYLKDGLLSALSDSIGGVLFGLVAPSAGQSILLVRGILSWNDAGVVRWP